MKAGRLAIAGSFCWNKDCPDYGKVKCKTCGRVFVGNKGTIFYGLHHSPKEILECLAMLAERNSLAHGSSERQMRMETSSLRCRGS